jgi:hypothetical protein
MNFSLAPRARIVASLSLGLLLASTITTARAQLVAWNVSGINAGSTNPFSATTVGTNISSGSMTLGSGITASTGASSFGGSGFDTLSLTAAIAGNDYISFTLTPSSGFAFDASSLSLTFGLATATAFNVALLTSATGFSAGNAVWSFSFNTASPATQTVTLSGVSALQNVSSSTEFRLYGYRDTSGSSTFRIRDLTGNDLSLSGSTISAIPEPSTYATAIGALIFGYILLRRRC